MANSWGTSWGVSWGTSWGSQQAHAIEAVDILSQGVIRRPIIDYSIIGGYHIAKTFIGFMLYDRRK